MVIAESQSAGRGRLGRRWTSPAGKGLLFSVVLRPAVAMSDAYLLTLVAAAAAAEGIEAAAGVRVQIKWPNDLFIDDRKAGGILMEVAGEQDEVEWVVVGIGINVNTEFSELPVALRRTATSLKMATGQAVDRSELLSHVLLGLERNYAEAASRRASGTRCRPFASATTCCGEASACRRTRARSPDRRPASTSAARCW